MQLVDVALLQAHPRNTYFFDDIEGEKWQDFLESVRTSGVIEPIVVSGNYVIVSGHQRVRACKELGIEKIPADVHLYGSDDALLKDLLETNVRQRGTLDNPVKIGRIAQELQRLYDLANLPKEEADRVRSRLQAMTGKSQEFLNRAKRIARLEPDIQDAVENGQIPATAAAYYVAKLDEDDQIKFALSLPAFEKWTSKQVETYVAMLQDKDEQIAEMQEDLDELRETLTGMEDGDKVLELQQTTRTAYERSEFLQKTIRDKDKEIDRMRNIRPLPPVVLSAEGLGACVQRFIDELAAFTDMVDRQTNRRTQVTYYNWLQEAADAIEALQLKCSVTYDEVAN